MDQRDHRKNLLAIYHAALAAVEGRRAVADFLRGQEMPGPVYLVAIGKAAASMARGAHEQLGNTIAGGVVITRHGYGQDITQRLPSLCLIEAGHPIPDERSILAGRVLLSFLRQIPGDGVLLFLLSGGASSLVEVLPEGVGLPDLQRANTWLLASGLPIDRVNAVRKSLSCIKGGRLARYLPPIPVWNLLISDVPGDDVDMIGSGLLVGQESGPLSQSIRDKLPAWLLHLVERAPAFPVDKLRSTTIDTTIVANSLMARQAAMRVARHMGYCVCLHEQDLRGEVSVIARKLVQCLRKKPAMLHVWGGETTVRLPDNPGQGGRCQHLALQVACLLQNDQGRACFFLAAGTDGSDGPGDTAGALVDEGSLKRGQHEGLDAGTCLQRADAGRFLQASGDLLQTGVTGTNVMDLMLGLGFQP